MRAKPGARRGYFVFIIRALSPTGALSHAIFVSDFQDLCYSCSWFPKRPRARPEATRARIAGRLLRSRRGSIVLARCCGGASFARPRAPVPAAEGRVGEKSGSQFGFARKPLKSPDSRKKETWNSLPPALDFLPNDLDFPSRGFGNPSTSLVKSRLSRGTAPLPLAFIVLRAAGEAPLPREGGARRFKM
jgi:hypothetical protein